MWMKRVLLTLPFGSHRGVYARSVLTQAASVSRHRTYGKQCSFASGDWPCPMGKASKAFRTIFLLSLMKPKIRSSFGRFVNMYKCIISVQFEEKQYVNLKQLLIWVQKRSYINTMKTKLFPNDDQFNIIKIYLKNPHGGSSDTFMIVQIYISWRDSTGF